MWIFLLSDTFIFSCFLLSYMTVRMSTTVPWPNPERSLRPHYRRHDIPLILIAIMTFILISSSGTMAMAVNFGYRRDRVRSRDPDAGDRGFRRNIRRNAGLRMDQADHGRASDPGAIPGARTQFGSSFFMITGFHGTHVTIGVIFLITSRERSGGATSTVERRGFFTSRKGHYEIVEITGLYWHFVDLVWVFIFAFFYLW